MVFGVFLDAKISGLTLATMIDGELMGRKELGIQSLTSKGREWENNTPVYDPWRESVEAEKKSSYF